MNLLDLFEADFPSHIKKSDIPPTMRSRMTMRDVEAERPQSPYRYRVGEKLFMDLMAAKAFAAGTGQQVQPIREEQLAEQEVDVPSAMNPENRGALVLTALEKDKEFARMSRRPIRIRMGGEQFVISDPDVKNNILTMASTYKKKGALPQFLLNLGQPDSLHFLLDKLSHHEVGVGGHAGVPRATRYTGESQQIKKKDNLNEKDNLASLTPRAQRIMQQVRLRQPQAQGDIEALAYDYDKQQKKDRQDIARLDKEQDDLESDIRQDLEKTIGRLRGKKGVSQDVLGQIERSDQAQNDAIKRIMQLDKEQQKAIDDLEQAVQSAPAKTGTTFRSTSTAAAPTEVPKAATTTPAPTVSVQQPTARADKSTQVKRKQSKSKSKSKSTSPSANVYAFPKQLKRGQTGELPGMDTGRAANDDQHFQLVAEKDRSPGKIDKSEDPCWSGYHMVGTKKKGGRTVPNCVPGEKGSANEAADSSYAVAVQRSGPNEMPV